MSRRLARETRAPYYKEFKKAFESDLLNTSMALFFLCLYISLLSRFGNHAINLYSKIVIKNVFSLLLCICETELEPVWIECCML